MATIVPVIVLCLAIASAVWTLLSAFHAAGGPSARPGGRPVGFAHLTAQLAVGLLGLVVAVGLARGVLDLPLPKLSWLDWTALVATTVAVSLCLWDRTARFPVAALYALGLIAIGMGQIHRGSLSGRFFLWAGSPEWSGFVIVAALLGWLLTRTGRVSAALRIPNTHTHWPKKWFSLAQAALTTAIALLAGWISIDFSFDNVGEGIALFGWFGRVAGCPAALMLIGATILMAWQTQGAERARWQYAAMVAGVLFTSSLGWASLDAVTDGDARWLHRSVTLLMTVGMMTFMTSFGLARIFPANSDWVTRGRQAAPAFGILMLLTLVIVLVQMASAA